MSVRIENNSVVFETKRGRVTATFHRTLRLPDDGKKYPLPAALGQFPVRNVRDFEGKVPDEWYQRGGVVIPMYYLEALWINFRTSNATPHAVKVGVGNVNVLSGERFSETLVHAGGEKYDYMVVPDQPWLDGIKTSPDSTVRQFVATRMGDGKSIEAQVTGEEKYGGFQLAIFPPKDHVKFAEPTFTTRDMSGGSNYSMPKGVMLAASADYSLEMDSSNLESFTPTSYSYSAGNTTATLKGLSPQYTMDDTPRSMNVGKRQMTRKIAAMNIGAGGIIEQKVYADKYGVDTWDQDACDKLFINIVSAYEWYELTGQRIPAPITRDDYVRRGIPFFHLEDYFKADVATWKRLEGVKSVTEMAERDGEVIPDNKSLNFGTEEPKPVLKTVYPKNDIVQNDW